MSLFSKLSRRRILACCLSLLFYATGGFAYVLETGALQNLAQKTGTNTYSFRFDKNFPIYAFGGTEERKLVYTTDFNYQQYQYVSVVDEDSEVTFYYILDDTNQTAALCGNLHNAMASSADFNNPHDFVYSEYTGQVVIPSTVTVGSTTYTVTEIAPFAFVNSGNTTAGNEGGIANDQSMLWSVQIPNTVHKIGDFAFAGCDQAIINYGDCEWDHYADLDDSNHNYIEFGIGVFANCSYLKSIALPLFEPTWNADTGIKVPDVMFINCSMLEEIDFYYDEYKRTNKPHISASYTNENNFYSIGKAAFAGCVKMKKFYNGNANVFTVLSKLTSLGEYAFYAFDKGGNFGFCLNSTLETIPKGCFEDSGIISFYAMANNLDGTETVLKNSKYTLPDNLKDLYVPNQLKSIGESAFKNCENLTSCYAVLVKTYGEIDQFNGTDGQKSLNFITSISKECFKNSSLQSLYANKVTKVGYSAFENCTSITNGILFASLKTIARNAFKGCTKFTNSRGWINLDDGAVIGSSAFENCENLTAVHHNFIEGAKLIEKNAFRNCSKFEIVLDYLSDYSDYLNQKSVVNHDVDLSEEFDIGEQGDTVTSLPHSDMIDEGTFENCTSAYVGFIDHKYIGARAFMNVQLESYYSNENEWAAFLFHMLQIPNALEIGDKAFYGMTRRLKDLYLATDKVNKCPDKHIYVYLPGSRMSPALLQETFDKATTPIPELKGEKDGNGETIYKNFPDGATVLVPLRFIRDYKEKTDSENTPCYWAHYADESQTQMNANWTLAAEIPFVVKNMDADYYTTLYSDVRLMMPYNEAWTYAVVKNAEGGLTAKRIAQPRLATGTTEDGTLPDVLEANTPVMLRENEKTPASCNSNGPQLLPNVTYVTAYNPEYFAARKAAGDDLFTGDAPTIRTAPKDNLLRGQLDPGMITPESGDGSWRYFKYSFKTGDITSCGFYWGAANGAPFKLVNYNKAYLVWNYDETSNAKGFSSFSVDDEMYDPNASTTALTGITEDLPHNAAFYNLQGQRVSFQYLKQGDIYIKDGKKFIKK